MLINILEGIFLNFVLSVGVYIEPIIEARNMLSGWGKGGCDRANREVKE